MALAPGSMVTRALSVASSQHVPGHYSEPDTSTTSATTQLSLAQAVYARRTEYTRPQNIRLRVGTWNVAAFNGTENDLGEWFVRGKGISESLSGLDLSDEGHGNGEAQTSQQNQSTENVGHQEQRWSKVHSTIPTVPFNDNGSIPAKDEVGIYVLGLQEVVDINSASEALRPYTDPVAAAKFKRALSEELPRGYQLIAERQLIGLLMLIYASPSVAPSIENVSTTSVGTGIMGMMGNKGAVTTRIILGETTRLAFINSHLSAGSSEKDIERRNWDAAQILQRTRFDPIVDSNLGITHPAEKIGDEDFAFWFGDLNYRLEGIPPDDVRRILMLHTRNEYDLGERSAFKIDRELSRSSKSSQQDDRSSISSMASALTRSTRSDSATTRSSNSSEMTAHDAGIDTEKGLDPASLQATIDSLLPHDELGQQQRQRKMFHDGWREGPITFLPTYKYDRGTVGVFDTGEKRRGPSWCDRILYRTRKDRTQYEEKLISESEARKRDRLIRAQGLDKAAEDENTLFEYDPDADADNDYDDGGSTSIPEQATVQVTTKDGFEDTIRLEHYLSHQRVLSSDHKPLVADFILTYEADVPDLKAAIQREVARELDKAENEGRPMITLVVDGSAPSTPESDGVDFGRLRYDDAKVRAVTIANTGRVPAQFGLVSAAAGALDSTPRWVSVLVDLPSTKQKPSKEDEEWFAALDKVFTIHPGDSTTVELTAQVSDKDLAKRLKDDESLEDVLVLRVKDGRDHFLPVRGTWHKSTHGVLLENLKKVPEHGLRMLQNQHPIGSWSRGSNKDSRMTEGELVNNNDAGSVPSQITRLTDCLETLIERNLAEWSMLGTVDEAQSQPWATVAGWPFVGESWELDSKSRSILSAIFNDALYADQSIDTAFKPEISLSQRVEVVAYCFLNLLRNLADGIVTEDLWTRLEVDYFSQNKRTAKLELQEQRVMVMQVLSTSPEHCAAFLHITSSLHRIATEISNTLREAQSQQDVSSRSKRHASLLSSPKVSMRSKDLDPDPAIANGYLIKANIAAAVSEVIVRVPQTPSRKGANTVEESRKLIFMFLDDP